MNGSEQVQYESRVRMRYAVVAFVAAILIVGSQFIQLTGAHTNVDELTLDLLVAHKRFPIDLIGAIIDFGGLLALAVMLGWLHQISSARNPQIRPFVRWLAVVGAVLAGATAIGYEAVIAAKANEFATTGAQTYLEAKRLTSGGAIAALPLLAELGSLLLTIGIVWISLNAMRVGLLTRMLGYVGAFAGALVLFPIGEIVPIVQGFWLVALSVLFAARWPSGNPPAWETGVAVPWAPVGQPRDGAAPPPRQPGGRRRRFAERDAIMAAATGGGTRESGGPAAGDVTPSSGTTESAASGRTRANTPKRKRKRRN